METVTEAILLRTMARKSLITGGIHCGLTVQNLLDLDLFFKLASNYYRYTTISYQDEILDEIGITPEFRIKKPGSDLDKFKEWKVFINKNSNLTELERFKIHSRAKKVRKAKYVNFEKRLVTQKDNLRNRHRKHTS